MINTIKIGERIKMLIDENGYKKSNICRLDKNGDINDNPHIEMTRQTLDKILDGRSSLSIEQLDSICDFFDCDTDYILCKQEEKKKEYKAISEFTNLSTTAAEEIMKMSPTEQKLLDRFFVVQPGMIWLIREMLKVASYTFQKGDIIINLPDGEARSETTKELEITLNQYDARNMLSYTLQREIENLIDSILEDKEMQKQAHQEMIAFYRKHPFTYFPKGAPLSASDLPKLSKDGERIVPADSDE